MRHATGAVLLAAALAVSAPARAHHPGANLDEAMGSRERYFEAVDRPALPFRLVDADGRPVSLSDFAGKVVVMHFVYASCPDVCPLHAEKLAEFQGKIARTPMRNMVRIVSITTDPANDAPDVMRAYGPTHGLDPVNWAFLTSPHGTDESATRTLAAAYGHRFVRTKDGYQMHGVVTHVIDRNGRWAANFHGLRFDTLNLVLYVNGLTNADIPARERLPSAGASFWERLMRIFR